MGADSEQSSEQTCGAVVGWEEAGPHAVEAALERGRMRLEAVADDILRVRFAPGGTFAPRRPWDVVEEPPGPPRLELNRTGAGLRLDTGTLAAELRRDTGALRFLSPRGESFAEDLGGPRWRGMSLGEIPALASVPDAELPEGAPRTGVFVDKRMAAGEGFYGLGQRTGRLDRRHRRLSNWTVDRSSPGHSRGHDNLYQAHPVLLAARPGRAWGLFLHSSCYTAFDVGAERDGVLTLLTLGGELDYYLLAGPTPAAVVEQLTRITGRPALPPLWALGYHQSRWSYGSDREVRELVQGFRERGIPLDAVHLDIHYMDGYRVFTWDGSRFPDPGATLDWLHRQGVRAVPIVDPGVKNDPEPGYAIAEQGRAGHHFVRGPDGEPFTGYVWPGEALFPDFCRSATRRWWGELHAGLLEAGADGVWCDMNEPAIVDRPIRTPGVRDKPIPLGAVQGDPPDTALHAEVHNLYGLLMARATAEGLERLRPDRRPWVLTRSAYTGVQRHAATWMGDNSSWWEHLEMSLPQILGMGLSGAPHAGVDIGGFYHNAFGELFARWMELGTFYPFMRCHTSLGSRAQEPWAFGPAVEEVARGAIELRYRLLPYLYTLAHEAHRSGAPILRALFYEFPDQAACYPIEDQVMLGPHLMLAPVYAPGVRRRLVELPEGLWYDFWTGLRLGSGALVHPAPPGRPPLFVRAGALLPLGNLRQSTAEPLQELTLEVFPGREADWTLIEDDGHSPACEEGVLAETTFELHGDSEGRTEVRIGPRRGGFQPAERELVLRVHLPAPPRAVRRDGADWTSRWVPGQRCLELRWPDDGAPHRVEVLGEPDLGRPGD